MTDKMIPPARLTAGLVAVTLVFGFVTATDARERSRAGHYTGPRTSGTFPDKTTRERGWQNERGQGSSSYQRKL